MNSVDITLVIDNKKLFSSISLTGDETEDREYIRRLAAVLYDDFLKTYKTKENKDDK